MTINSWDKIHFVKNGRYICNGAVDPIKEKSTTIRKKVNCRNCLNKLEKEKWGLRQKL